MRTAIFVLVLTTMMASRVLAQIVDEVPRQTAVTWLALVDEGKYSESWKTASPLFQKAITEEDWVKKIQKTRKSEGSLKKRDFVRGRFMQDPANMPKGQYFALEFLTEFEDIKITELVVSMTDETGLWQIASYSISTQTPKPAP